MRDLTAVSELRRNVPIMIGNFLIVPVTSLENFRKLLTKDFLVAISPIRSRQLGITENIAVATCKDAEHDQILSLGTSATWQSNWPLVEQSPEMIIAIILLRAAGILPCALCLELDPVSGISRFSIDELINISHHDIGPFSKSINNKVFTGRLDIRSNIYREESDIGGDEQITTIGLLRNMSARYLRKMTTTSLELEYIGRVEVIGFSELNYQHIAVIKGDIQTSTPIVRLHSKCLFGDVFHSMMCDCCAQLQLTLRMMGDGGSYVLLYLDQEGRDIGLIAKMMAYNLQSQGYSTVEANKILGFESDERDFIVAANMLKALGVKRCELLTNNTKKLAAVRDAEIEVVSRIAIHVGQNEHNKRYLDTKLSDMGYMA